MMQLPVHKLFAGAFPRGWAWLTKGSRFDEPVNRRRHEMDKVLKRVEPYVFSATLRVSCADWDEFAMGMARVSLKMVVRTGVYNDAARVIARSHKVSMGYRWAGSLPDRVTDHIRFKVPDVIRLESLADGMALDNMKIREMDINVDPDGDVFIDAWTLEHLGYKRANSDLGENGARQYTFRGKVVVP